MVSRCTRPGRWPAGSDTRVLHVSARIEDADFEALCGLYPDPPAFHWLIVGAAPGDFASLRGEFEDVLASFRSEAPPPPSAPTPTYLQKAFSDIQHPRRGPAR